MSQFSSCLFLHEDSFELLDALVPKKILINKEKLVIGRGSPKLAVDVTIVARKNDKDIISRQHAEILTTANGDCSIRDMGALNGIFVNGVKINTHKLAHGDLVQFGGISNVEFGTKLTNSDVSLKYVYSTNSSTPAKKRKDDHQTSSSLSLTVTSSSKSSNKRSKGGDSLLSVICPSVDLGSSTDSPIGTNKAELQVLHVSYLNQIDKLKQKNKELEKQVNTDLLSLKSQATEQLKTIAVRDKAIQAMKAEAGDLQDSLKKLQNSLNTEESRSSGLETEIKTLKEKLAKAAAASAAVVKAPPMSSSVSCDLSRSTLLGSLQCSLCEGLLVEAAVLRCSHGFCRACIEQHWKISSDAKPKYSSARATSTQVCRCPRCNAGAKGTVSVASSKVGNSVLYVRSDHLDGLVWLLLEASGTTSERKDFEIRESAHRKTLLSLGIDPDCTPVTDSPDEDAEAQTKHTHAASKKAGETTRTSSAMFCDYCGGKDHPEAECPHRLKDVSSSESEGEDSDNESDM